MDSFPRSFIPFELAENRTPRFEDNQSPYIEKCRRKMDPFLDDPLGDQTRKPQFRTVTTETLFERLLRLQALRDFAESLPLPDSHPQENRSIHSISENLLYSVLRKTLESNDPEIKHAAEGLQAVLSNDGMEK